MKTIITLLLCLFIVFPAAASETEILTIDALKWLSGCWQSVGAEPGSGEQWTSPAGGTLLGVSRTNRNSKTVAFEFMQIRASENNKIEFIARPSGQTGSTFVMIAQSQGKVIFENAAHDFPQRIIYHLESDIDLKARIEGEVNGKLKAVDFSMKRVDCLSQIP
jgi:hypothetical protein